MKFKFYAIKLCVFILVVFLTQVFINGFTELFILDGNSFAQPWRFLTAIFLHGGIGHLVLNLFALALFGSVLENFVGGRRFLCVFSATGILANLISVFFYGSSLGASGAIFGVIGALIIVRPLMVVWAFGFAMPLFVAGILWASADIFGAIGFLTGNPLDNTGNIAHLSGMFFGFLFGAVYKKMLKKKSKKINVSLDENEIRTWEKRHIGR